MHHHTFAALDSDTAGAGDPILVVNDPDAAYAMINSLNEITKHSDGDAIGVNKYVKFVLWGVINKSGEVHPMMLNLPSEEYNSANGAAIDVNGYSNFTIPAEFNLESSTGFLIAAFVCKHTASAMEIESTIDHRGQTPSTASGSGTGGGDVTAATAITDNAIVRGDGGAKGVQGSGVIIDDGDSVTGIDDLVAVGLFATSAITTPLIQNQIGPISVKAIGDITLDAFQNGANHEVVVENTGAADVVAGLSVEGTARFASEVANATPGATPTIDWQIGNKQTLPLDATITSLTFTDPAGPASLILRIVQDSTPRTIAGGDWATILWPGSTEPTLSTGSGAIDIIALYYAGGGVYYGVASQDFS